MVLEAHMKLCMTEPDFPEIFFCSQNWENGPKTWFFGFIEKLIFTEFALWWKFILFAVFLYKSHIWENSGSWDMGQNVLSQSDCRFFNQPYLQNKSIIAWFFAYWYKFTWIKSWSKKFWVDMVGNGCGQSGHGTLKLSVSREWIDGMNWFLYACWCKFRKTKSYFNHFFGGCGNLVHETLKSAEWLSWFFAYWLWCSNFWLDQHQIFYLWLINVNLLQLYLLAPQW